MFYRQRMLVIDGKYSSDDGLSTSTMCQVGTRSILGETQQSKLMKTRRDSVEVHAECKSVLVHLMENRQAKIKTSSATMIAMERS
jgi:hypothetical protein